jgi:transposase
MRKKNPYSTIPVKSVDLEPLLAGRDGQACWIGIDISKHWLTVAICWGNKQFERVWKVDYPSQLPLLLELLRRLAAGRELVIAIEPTGSYGDPLRWALHQAGLSLQRVESKASHDYAEVFDGVPGQNDAKDALLLGELASQGNSCPWPYLALDDTRQQMLFWVEQAQSQQQVLAVWTGRIEALLARHWPEATAILDGTSGTLLRVLIAYGSPAGLAEDAEAEAQLRRWGGSWLKPEKIQALIASARSTLGVPVSPLEAQRLQASATAALEADLALQASKRELAKFVPGHAALEAMAPALGPATACVLYAKLGDPRDYHSPRAYLKAAGLNLKERSSGLYQGQLKISKRGPALVRQWLYLAAVRSLREPNVRQWFERKSRRDAQRCGGGRKGVGCLALTALMRKLLVALWTVRTKGLAFAPARLCGAETERASV